MSPCCCEFDDPCATISACFTVKFCASRCDLTHSYIHVRFAFYNISNANQFVASNKDYMFHYVGTDVGGDYIFERVDTSDGITATMWISPTPSTGNNHLVTYLEFDDGTDNITMDCVAGVEDITVVSGDATLGTCPRIYATLSQYYFLMREWLTGDIPGITWTVDLNSTIDSDPWINPSRSSAGNSATGTGAQELIECLECVINSPKVFTHGDWDSVNYGGIDNVVIYANWISIDYMSVCSSECKNPSPQGALWSVGEKYTVYTLTHQYGGCDSSQPGFFFARANHIMYANAAGISPPFQAHFNVEFTWNNPCDDSDPTVDISLDIIGVDSFLIYNGACPGNIVDSANAVAGVSRKIGSEYPNCSTPETSAQMYLTGFDVTES